jgi:hypothetical protein
MSSIQEQLEQAYELIQNDEEDEALAILRPIVRQNPKNMDAWWLISYATDDPREARLALVNTLKLNPDHPKARGVLTQLNEMVPPSEDELTLLKEVAPPVSASMPTTSTSSVTQDDSDVDDLFADILEDEKSKKKDKDREKEREADRARSMEAVPEAEGKDLEKAGEDRGFSTVIQVLLGAVVVLMAIVLGATLLNEQNTSKDANEGREDLNSLEAGEPVVELVNLDLGDPNRTPLYTETELGKTLFVESCVCITDECQGPPLSDLIYIITESIQSASLQVKSANVADKVKGVGVDVKLCNADDTIYRAYMSVDAVPDASTPDDIVAGLKVVE